MKHSTRRSTVCWTPDFNRVKPTACCRKPSRRFVRPRRTRSKQFRRCALTRPWLNQCVNEALRRRTLILLLLCFPLRSPLVQSSNATTPIATLAELQTRIHEHIGQPRFASAFWGVKIVSLDSGKPLLEHNAGKLFKPASNAKLFTGALALDRLGPD